MNSAVTVLVILSAIGDDLVYLLISSVILFLHRGLGVRLLSLVLVSMFLNQLLKYWLGVPRPNAYAIDIDDVPNAIRVLVIGEGPSLPSGHAQISSTFWLSLALSIRNIPTYICALVIPSLISYSRIALGMHSEVDVFVGMLVGYSIPLIAYIASTKLIKPSTKVVQFIEIALLLIISVISQLLNYPNIHLIAGLMIGVRIMNKLTYVSLGSALKKVITTLLSLTTLGFTYAVISSEIIGSYPFSRSLEFLAVLSSAVIAYVLIPVGLNIFKLK